MKSLFRRSPLRFINHLLNIYNVRHFFVFFNHLNLVKKTTNPKKKCCNSVDFSLYRHSILGTSLNVVLHVLICATACLPKLISDMVVIATQPSAYYFYPSISYRFGHHSHFRLMASWLVAK